MTTMTERRLTVEDAKISRCTCGAWVYDMNGCSACSIGKPLDRAALIEDVEWLLSMGETHVETIATRVRMSPVALLQRLRRYRRSDLTRRMDHTHEFTHRREVAA